MCIRQPELGPACGVSVCVVPAECSLVWYGVSPCLFVCHFVGPLGQAVVLRGGGRGSCLLFRVCVCGCL